MEKDSKDKTNNQKKEEKKEEEKQVKLELFEEEDYFEEFEDGNISILNFNQIIKNKKKIKEVNKISSNGKQNGKMKKLMITLMLF